MADNASDRVGEILAAAEQAAEEMRLEAEQRLRDRIAEGDRAAANRVQAAEAEALEILAAAQEQADKLVDDARRQARDIIGEAGAKSREVLRDGTELSGHLRELSASLRSNAELLLRDVRDAHAEMTARLDQAAPADTRPAASSADLDDFDVPEFHPGR
jgi:cell division septum initiation protein DivIVA